MPDRFELALTRFRELYARNWIKTTRKEFASSFSENLAATAVAAGEVTTARQVYTTLLARFGESPNLRQKIQAELKRLDRVGKPAPAFATLDLTGRRFELAVIAVNTSWSISGLHGASVYFRVASLASRLSHFSRRRLRIIGVDAEPKTDVRR